MRKAHYTICRLGSNPRSRRVYRAATAPAPRTTGSSPLARGLLVGNGICGPEGGIIPARAGFTVIRPLMADHLEDHPRSRGVYGVLGHRGPPHPGSSPLARGLPPRGVLRGAPAGIIPARAGFTSPSRGTPLCTPDHPRSRGVYKVLDVDDRRSPWIIPARAGFTPAAVRRRSQRGDHPRSRGVYAPHRASTAAKRGSSPLARGLPDAAAQVHDQDGIIPARAGFTAMTWTPRSGRTDHPRSRGVYTGGRSTGLRLRGSSPLARGLRRHRRGAHLEGRIIPARAGFTGQLRVGRDSVRDHPRSRGVYSLVGSLADAGLGSSPLARGLREPLLGLEVDVGIIPARAGFTWERPATPCGLSDHPRSRGVYAPWGIIPAHVIGSSPLARGLLWTVDGTLARNRIIPARAGFTPSGAGGPRSREDHPRSRGVYDAHGHARAARPGSSPLARGLLLPLRGR